MTDKGMEDLSYSISVFPQSLLISNESFIALQFRKTVSLQLSETVLETDRCLDFIDIIDLFGCIHYFG